MEKTFQPWLIIDDHQMFSGALALTLGSLVPELSVTTVPSAEAALQLLAESDTHHFALALLDLDLPDIHGQTLCELLLQRYPELPVLVCSANPSPVSAQQLRASGARGYVTKDQSAEALLQAAREVLAGAPWVTTEALAQLTASTEAAPELLSRRQLSILRLMQAGQTVDEIARQLHLSANTIKTHIRLMYDKLDARNRSDCLRIAARLGLL
ncbi:response regulator [Saccharospirillum mangrovi]|uniref:response regulator n=1 Tax=Saccharospirillum mangrovi TaxID=2161747 RepID=UPI000D3425AC|nr:response regulator transcription factor [Saccharospirillum mangrovi]